MSFLRKHLAALALAGFIAAAPLSAGASATPQLMTDVPMDIYQWVLATPRTSYYFNRRSITYGADSRGNIDINTLHVAILQTYDYVHIQDVLAKRRWHMEDYEKLETLAGAAVIVTIDLPSRAVVVEQEILLNCYQDHLETRTPNTIIPISSLPEKSVERRLYDSIINWAEENEDLILAQTPGKISEADKEKLEEMKAKRLKAKKAEEKRLAREKRAAEKQRLAAEKAVAEKLAAEKAAAEKSAAEQSAKKTATETTTAEKATAEQTKTTEKPMAE